LGEVRSGTAGSPCGARFRCAQWPRVSPLLAASPPGPPADTVLLGVDQRSANGRVRGLPQNSPIRSAPSKVGEHQDAEQLGAGSRTEGIQPFTKLALDVLQVHERGR
jgi:hypothetical protein